MSNINHVLGISGGKDSAALAIYMKNHYPDLDINYYTCDTGKELKETYALIERLNSYLGKDITLYNSIDEENSPMDNPFDHFLATYGGYLPSPQARWCTNKMKLQPFEDAIGDTPTISYVGIRGDENREGYVSTKENIQTIFPFRRNIWSKDVTDKTFHKDNIDFVLEQYRACVNDAKYKAVEEVLRKPISIGFTNKNRLELLLNIGVKAYNKVIFAYLKTTDYPIGKLDYFPLVEDENNLGVEDIYKLLEDSSVGIPEYYKPVEYQVEIDGEIKKGIYSRSRSGCFFCFYQQKIEWVWLLEQHPELFAEAKKYEKEGYTWMQESLVELEQPERVKAIKLEHYKRTKRAKSNKSSWQDDILNAEGDGCASCFI